MTTTRAAVAILFALVSVGEAAAQSCPITEDRVRNIVAGAVVNHRNERDILKAVDTAVQGGGPKISTSAVTLHATEDAMLLLISPYTMYRTRLSEALRKMEPLDRLEWTNGYMVTVYPRQIDAPDFERIVVQRAGAVVEPTAIELKPQPMKTRMGAERIIHAGFVMYPCAAFTPDTDVTITAIPRSGHNVVATVKAKTLANLR